MTSPIPATNPSPGASTPPTATALILIAPGVEELEAVAPIDLLRRAQVFCQVAAVGGSTLVVGRNGIGLQADCLLAELAGQVFDLLVLPGGPCAADLRCNPQVLACVQEHQRHGSRIAAICAAPTILQAAGVLGTAPFTAHASVASFFDHPPLNQPVVVSGLLTTSQGAGTAVLFGLALVAQLAGPKAAEEVARAIHHP